VHRHDRFDRLPCTLAKRCTCRPVLRTALQVVVERLRAHAVGPLVDVDKLRAGASLADRLYRRDERVRDCDHRVALTDTRGHQCKTHRVGAVGYTHAVLCAAVLSELPFQAIDLCAANERR
jgi:hypothetical protein